MLEEVAFRGKQEDNFLVFIKNFWVQLEFPGLDLVPLHLRLRPLP